MRGKKSFLLMIALVFILILSACGNNGGGTQKTASGTGSDKTSATDSSQGSDTGQSSEENMKPQNGGSLVVGSIGSPTTFNAYYITDVPSQEVANFIFNGLTTVNKKNEPVGDLAKSWDISDDGLTYTFHLQKGVKFQDGKPMTSADVVFSYNIPRSKDYTGPRASAFEWIKSIKAPDKYTVKITLKRPYAPFLVETATYPILPKHLLKDVSIKDMAKAKFNTKAPVGTGPYKFVEWKDGQYVKLTANKNYFKGRPHIDTLIYKIVPDPNSLLAQFKAGQVDMIAVQPQDISTAKQMVQQGKAKLKTYMGMSYTYLGYNLRNPLFKNKEVRQALTMSINRKAIVKSILNGQGKVANSPGNPISWAFNPDVPKFPYNPEKAKKILAKHGWKDTNGDGILDKNGKKFAFTIKTNQGNKTREQTATVIQQELKKVGIKVTPKIVEWSAFIKQIEPPNFNFDAELIGWSLGSDPDPTQIWGCNQIKKGLNNVAYCNKSIQPLIEKNTKIVDRQKRKEVLGKIKAQIAEDQPYTFLYYPLDNIMYTPKLHNVKSNSVGQYYHIYEWWLEQGK
ncbi:MAG TPA: peptide-binding protein [Bacillales bacterium]|nr:peptide-binding protein [Bacillales bacterium]